MIQSSGLFAIEALTIRGWMTLAVTQVGAASRDSYSRSTHMKFQVPVAALNPMLQFLDLVGLCLRLAILSTRNGKGNFFSSSVAHGKRSDESG